MERVNEVTGYLEDKNNTLHPQSDGMVERHNRTISNYLSLFVSVNQRDWDKLVPLLLLSYRSAQHEATGYTPFMLLTGREMKLPIDLMSGSSTDGNESEPFLPEYVNDLKERLRKVHEFARNKLQLKSDRMKISFYQKTNPVTFTEGDAVWLFQPKRLVSKITETLGRTLSGYKKINVHIERLSSYHGRDPPYWNKVDSGEKLQKGE